MSTWSVWTPFNITSPIFLIILVGHLLRRTGLIDEAFITTSSRLVFTVTLPLLMFLAITNSALEVAAHWPLVVFSAIAASITPACAYAWSRVATPKSTDTGAFVKAAFR